MARPTLTPGRMYSLLSALEILIQGIVAAVSGRYDLFDPTSEPIFRGAARPAGPYRAESA